MSRPTSRAGNSRRRRGYSLLELLVVVTLIAVAASLVPPAYEQVYAEAEIKAAARRVAATLRYARTLAITTQTEQLVEFDLATRRYAAPAAHLGGKFPAFSELRLVTARGESRDATRGTIRFLASGGATGGQLTIAHGDLRLVVDVDWLTGRVKIYDART